jgi:hypothetical protein
VADGSTGGVDRNRVARLKALGNALVPQVAYSVLMALREADTKLREESEDDEV